MRTQEWMGGIWWVVRPERYIVLVVRVKPQKPRLVKRAVQDRALMEDRYDNQPARGSMYSPLKLVVYEDEEGRTFVAFDNFVSLLVQYQCEEITQVALLVEQKLEALVA